MSTICNASNEIQIFSPLIVIVVLLANTLKKAVSGLSNFQSVNSFQRYNLLKHTPKVSLMNTIVFWLPLVVPHHPCALKVLESDRSTDGFTYWTDTSSPLNGATMPHLLQGYLPLTMGHYHIS